MTRDIKRAGLLLAVCGLALLAAVPLGRSEVNRTSEPPQRAAPDNGVAVVPADQQALRAQCWQEGVKIIDQDGLQGLALNEALKKQSVTFSNDGRQPQTLILPFADGMCLIRSER
jgi:hypothetical protein